MANSRIGDRPIAAAHWPLVDLAAVHSREINGRTLTLVPSGWTYENLFARSPDMVVTHRPHIK